MADASAGGSVAVPIEPDAPVRPNPRCTFRRFADGSGAVLLHLDTAAYHGLNPIGAAIWEALGEGTSFRALIADLRAQIEDPPGTFEAEVSVFLRDLAARDLVIVGTHQDAGDAATGPRGS